jgi:16S rRNA (guanine966-N2)-methyltransferase
MRIIAGEFRGRPLLSPQGDTTRPITDRVKQSLFDILAPLLPEARVYDCFAGTGSMGLECLSRGATHATFFETDRSAITLLKKNIQTFDLAERAMVIPTDIFRWFHDAPAPPQRANIIFLDPPYRFLREKSEALQQLAKQMMLHHLASDGTLVFRHDQADSLALPALQVYDQRTYGSMAIEFLKPATTEDGRPTTD